MTATSQPIPQTAPQAADRLPVWARNLLGSQEFVLLLSIVVLFVVVGTSKPRFLSENNLSTIFLGNAYIAVAAVGMSMVIISGNIDISVGSLIGVLATISGTIAVSGYPVWLAWLLPLILGGLVGAVNGFLVAYLRIPAIVVTLGMLSILKGGLISVTRGEWIRDLPQEYFLSQMRPLNIPMPVYFMVILTVLAALWMRYSPAGRAIYAVGGNAEAARLSGISYRGTILRVFILNGVIVGIASVLFATQLSIIQSTVPQGVELLIISSAVVGGVSILGGTGTVIGSTLAAILLSAIGNALIFIDVSPYWYKAVQGILILLTVLADIFRRRRQLRQLKG
jgi:ribose/xylose/arabinose/galactoside ABC-type transport system permease subunit